MAEFKTVAVVMAGGQGTRFWPLSHKRLPKQYLPLIGDTPLINQTISRLGSLVDKKDIFVCTAKEQEPIARKELPGFDNLILEPMGKNTGPCIALSVHHLLQKGYREDTVLICLPADHYVKNPDIFSKLLKQAAGFASSSGDLVTLGTHPTFPHTGFGYIETGKKLPFRSPIFKVKRFREKPPLALAKKFVKRKTFFWNSGIFVWTLGSIKQALQKHMPAYWNAIVQSNPDTLLEVYKSLKPVPIDIGVMEKAKNVAMVPAKMGWNDIGSWNALYDLLAKKRGDNILYNPHAKTWKSSGCLVLAPESENIALIGVTDLIIVESKQGLLILNRKDDQLVRDAARAFDGSE